MKKLYKFTLTASAMTILLMSGGWQYSARPYFEGEIIYSIGMNGGAVMGTAKDIPEKMILAYRGNWMKMRTTGSKKTREVIYDLSNQLEYKIDHDKQVVYKKSQQKEQAQFGAIFREMEFTLEAKPDTLAIAGYTCKRNVITVEMEPLAMTIDLFTTDKILVPFNAGNNPLMDQLGFEVEEIKGFPLGMKFSFHFQGKSESIMMEAEDVVKKKIPFDFFELPKGYEVVEQ